MSTVYLHPSGQRFVEGPGGLCVRIDLPNTVMILWKDGFKRMDVASVPSSWQVLDDEKGSRPLRIRRTRFPGFSHGANSIEVEFL